MDILESCHDIAARQPGLNTGAGEHLPINGGFLLLDTPNLKSSAASLLCLSGPIEPQLQRVLDWVESPPFPATPDWIEFPLATPQFEELKKLEQLGYFWEQTLREFALLPTSKCGSATLRYRSSKVAGKKVTRQPDAQFLSDLRRLPSLIIEVAWTQTTKNLQELACDYILGSNARIRTVIGFEVDPSARKGATVCVWRIVYNGDNIAVACDSTEIRSVSGVKNPDPQAGLRLTLEDFAYPRSLEEYPDLNSVVIFIPVDDLYEILEQAEAAQECFRHRDESESEEKEPIPPTANKTASHGYSLRSRDWRGVQKK